METIALLKLIEAWQKAIVIHLRQQKSTELRQSTIHLIIIILCLYWCEKHQVIPTHTLQNVCDRDDPRQALRNLWQGLGNRFGQSWKHFTLADDFNPQLLQSMIGSLYYPQAVELPIESLGQVYERLLSLFDAEQFTQNLTDMKGKFSLTRKVGGVYYTPQQIVQYMVNETIERIYESTDRPQILDPTCGSGAFLIAAYQALIDRQQACRRVDQIAQSLESEKLDFNTCQNLLKLIHGVDIDPEAVAVTQLSLSLKLLENVDVSKLTRFDILINLDQTIQCGNALVSTIAVSNQDRSLGTAAFPDWQTVFPEAIESGGFDIVIGNPPYIDAEWMSLHLPEWRSYCTTHYLSASGNWDLFCVFVEKAVQLCRIGGLTSLVIPNKFLSANYAASARSLLLHTSQILTIRDYAQVNTFAALVYPIVYIAQKLNHDPKSELRIGEKPTQYEKMNTIDQVGLMHSIVLAPETTQAWVMGVSSQTDLLQKLDRFPKLGELTLVIGAATVTEAYQLKPLLQSQSSPTSGDLTVMNSGTIDRYQLLWGKKALRYLGQSYLHPIIAENNLSQLPRKRLMQAQQPKIIVAGMVQRLEAALDPIGGILAAKSTTIIQAQPLIQAKSEQAIDLRYLLGVLNSSLINWFFQTRFTGNRLQGGYLRVGPPQLRQIPIVLPNLTYSDELDLYNQMIDLVDQQCKLAKSSIALDDQIDQIVYRLYQLTDSEIELVMA